jgi:hypothetical protein
MKPSKTVPKGPRVVPLEEYQAHGLDHPTAAACLFFSPFLALQKQLTTPKPPEWRCSFVDRSGKTQDLGTHSGTRSEIAGKIRMAKSLPYWLEVELKDKTGEIFIEDFSTARGMSRHPVVFAEVKDDTQDPTSHHFRNFNWSPLPLAPKHAPLGLPKSAPPSIPEGAECRPLAEFIGWIDKNSRPIVEKLLVKVPPSSVYSAVHTHRAGTAYERHDVAIFTPFGSYSFPSNQETPASV